LAARGALAPAGKCLYIGAYSIHGWLLYLKSNVCDCWSEFAMPFSPSIPRMQFFICYFPRSVQVYSRRSIHSRTSIARMVGSQFSAAAAHISCSQFGIFHSIKTKLPSTNQPVLTLDVHGFIIRHQLSSTVGWGDFLFWG